MADVSKSLAAAAAAAAATPAAPRPSAGERTFSLCAVDLDGTLLAWRSAAERHTERDTNPDVSRANVEALRRCNEEVGMEVVLATGRGPASAARVADRVLGLGCPLVCNNGACVLSRSERRLRQTPETDEAWGQRRVLHSSYYPRKFVVGCARLAAAAETMLCIYHPDPDAPSGCAISFCGSVPVSVDDGGINVMVCADEFPDECSPRLSAAQRELVRRSHNALHRLEGDAIATSSAASCCWKLLMWSVGAARDALRSAVENTLHPEAEGIQILTPEPFLLEFVPPMTNKAAGLRVLCKALRHDGDDDDDDDDDDHGVELSDVLAFGDGTNDVEMLASVGEGVCMANGGEAARAAATRISRWAHHEDAVAHELAAICGWPDDISSISRPTPPR